jgi:predicted deacylase
MPATHQLQAHRYSALTPGPKLIVTGAVHGNETCGTQAIRRLLAELERGAVVIERGTLTLLPVCNPLAYANHRRAGERNLNRRLQPTGVPREYEDLIANLLCPWLAEHDALLDLHSFRSPGRPFVLRGPANNDGTLEPFAREAEESALAAHLGVNRVVDGWMSAYAEGVERRRARLAAGGDAAAAAAIEDPSYGIGTTEYMRSRGGYAVTLECGQHADPEAPEVAYRAILNTLALLQMIDAAPPQPAAPFECLRLATVVDRLHEGDTFVKNWTSFDPLADGELIARRHDGTAVRAPGPGYIVFPDTSARPGHEWFYLAQRSARELQP